jgi:hypothetical protein
MNLSAMIALVRNDLHDQEEANYRWTDAEVTRQINRAVGELSESLPLPVKATLSTIAGSNEIELSGLSDRIMVAAIEYPVGEMPASYQQFSIWGDILTITSGNQPDGTNCNIYYGVRHTLDSQGSTVPEKYEDLVVGGACGYSAIAHAIFAINRVNVGGVTTPGELLEWGNQKIKVFRAELRRLGRRAQVRSSLMFASETT